MDGQDPGNTDLKSLTTRLEEAGFINCSMCTICSGLEICGSQRRVVCNRQTELVTLEKAKTCPGPLAPRTSLKAA